MIGELIGGYRLTEKLGEGGTGETFLAEHPDSKQKVAVKVLFAAMSTDKEAVGAYLDAVRTAGRVNHVGITDILDCGVHASGRAFVVMEYLAGKSLTDALIELGSVSDVGSLADMGWQVASILQALHGAKLLHGALKPDGIFLTFPARQAPRPQLKLLDFGLAKFTLSLRQSQTGSLLGAPLYMAPEVARGVSSADHRADIYSLGCILFEMACGRPPFVREGKGELIIAHATEPAPFVSSLEPSIPQAIDNLIGRMLTKNPAVRPQSMAEVAAALAKFCPTPPVAVEVPAPSAAPAMAAPKMPAAVAGVFAPAPASYAPTAAAEPARRPPPVVAIAMVDKPSRPSQPVIATAILDPPSRPSRPVVATAILDSPSRPTGPVMGGTAILDGPPQEITQASTVLLSSQSSATPAQAKTEYLPGSHPAWLERVRQRTVMLDSATAQAAIRKSSRRLAEPGSGFVPVPSTQRPSEPSRRTGQSTASVAQTAVEPPSGRSGKSRHAAGAGKAIDVPVVVISALAVLAVGFAVLLLAHRKPASKPAASTSSSAATGSPVKPDVVSAPPSPNPVPAAAAGSNPKAIGGSAPGAVANSPSPMVETEPAAPESRNRPAHRGGERRQKSKEVPSAPLPSPAPPGSPTAPARHW
jgi:hypothetical protein